MVFWLFNVEFFNNFFDLNIWKVINYYGAIKESQFAS